MDPPNLATVQFAQTTIYHWPMFADNATSLPKTPKVVTGPFQFGEAVELDKTQSEVGDHLACRLQGLELTDSDD